MRNYIVKFYRKAEREGDKHTFLGSVEVDDVGTGPGLSLTAKAFRLAGPKCIMANLVRVERA